MLWHRPKSNPDGFYHVHWIEINIFNYCWFQLEIETVILTNMFMLLRLCIMLRMILWVLGMYSYAKYCCMLCTQLHCASNQLCIICRHGCTWLTLRKFPGVIKYSHVSSIREDEQSNNTLQEQHFFIELKWRF